MSSSHPPPFLQLAPPFLPTVHHDVYPSISPAEALAGAASGLSVLITGSGRGVGRAEALAFANAGAKRVGLTSRSRGELEEVKKAIGKVAEGTEVVRRGGRDERRERCEAFWGGGGVLVNNAGFLEPPVPLRDSTPSTWWKTHEINTLGTYLVTRAFLRAAHAKGLVEAAQKGGKKLTVINTSSVGSVATMAGLSSYQSGKTQINRFTEFLHFEEPSIRSFAFHPGSIRTKLAEDSFPPEWLEGMQDSPDLPGAFAVWLATQDKADFLRGRYLSANWDVDELLARQSEIVEQDLLWTRVRGMEQVMPH
ncbi:hypothetical protein JCM6882_008964 [Rhodosporidiobolus microsporus]